MVDKPLISGGLAEHPPSIARATLSGMGLAVLLAISVSLISVYFLHYGGNPHWSPDWRLILQELAELIVFFGFIGTLLGCVAGLKAVEKWQAQESIAVGRGNQRIPINDLIRLLDDPDANHRAGAAIALGEGRNAARRAVPALIRALKDPVGAVRHESAVALGKIGPEHRAAIRALVAGLSDPYEDVTAWCAYALKGLGPKAEAAIPALIEALGHESCFVQSHVASALAAIGPRARVPSLAEALMKLDPLTRSKLLEQLGEAAPEIDATIPPLLTILQQQDSSARSEAVRAMGEAAIPALIEACGCSDCFVRLHAIDALGEVGASTPAAIGTLIGLVDHRDLMAKLSAINALGRSGPKADSAVPRLIEALRDPDVRSNAALALGSIGPGARTAVPHLARVMRAGNGRECAAAATAYWKLTGDPIAAVPSLLRVLEGTDNLARTWAIEALGSIGPEAEEVIPALVEALNETWGVLNAGAAHSLGQIGPQAASAVPALNAALEADHGVGSPDSNTRLEAALALWRIARRAEPAVSVLIECLGRDGSYSQCYDDEGVVRCSISSTRPAAFRLRVVQALGEIGAAASAVVPYLIEAMKDTDESLAQAAGEALDRIHTPPPPQPAGEQPVEDPW